MTDDELREKVARVMCEADNTYQNAWPAYAELATAAIAAVREAEGPTNNDLYYLRAINRRLAEFQEALDGVEALSIGGEAFADERDWLDCYIDRLTRPLPTPPEDTE